MKKIYTLLLACMAASNVFAQEAIVNTTAKLSPQTRLLLQKMQADGRTYPAGYVYYKDAQAKVYLKGMVQLRDNPQNAAEDMEKLGVQVGTKAGKIWTVQVPFEKLQAFTAIKGLSYIQLDEPLAPAMDEARRLTRADSVHQGINLTYPFNGDGVVMGIIDVGYDYTHPAFYDTAANGYRVKRVWEQKSTGTPPAAFSYGNELTTTAAILAKGSDGVQTHGTHVAGIAAGSGFGGSTDNRKFRGFSFMSDLVFVGITPTQDQWINTGCSDMLDGMKYIFDYAGSVGKPAVANLSWGSPAGPVDGTSLFSQACDNLVGSGKIFVCSAGNNGEDKLHISKTFNTTDTLLHTFLNIATSPVGKETWVDIWGDPAKQFCAQVKLYHNGIAIDSTGFNCLDNAVHNQYLIGSNSDTLFVDMVTSDAEFNGRPRIFLSLKSKITDSVCISLKSTGGLVHMRNAFVYQSTGYYGSFENYGYTWATAGNTDVTISDIASTKKTIAVGAYASKTVFTNVGGQQVNYSGYVPKLRLVPFSSHGPATDGRVKPDITAPGLLLISSVSSYDTTFIPGGSSYGLAAQSFQFNGRTYVYAGLMGTSMSSPSVSGIVGMMLQANPKLTPEQVKDIIFETAIEDTYTGNLPPAGTNSWGHGKINAYGAVKRTWETNSVKEIVSAAGGFSLFPNPGSGNYVIDYTATKNETAIVRVYDVKGSLVSTGNWQLQPGLNTWSLSLDGKAKGIYFTQLAKAGKIYTIKTVLE